MITNKRLIVSLLSLACISLAASGFSYNSNSVQNMVQQTLTNSAINTAQQYGSNLVRNYLFANPSTVPMQQINNTRYGLPFNTSSYYNNNYITPMVPINNLLPNIPNTNSATSNILPNLIQSAVTTQLSPQQLSPNNYTNINGLFPALVTQTQSRPNLIQQIAPIITSTTTTTTRPVQTTGQQPLWLVPNNAAQVMANIVPAIPQVTAPVTNYLLSSPGNLLPSGNVNNIPMVNNLNALQQQITNRQLPQVVLPNTNPVYYNSPNTMFMALPQAVQQQQMPLMPKPCGCGSSSMLSQLPQINLAPLNTCGCK